MVFLGSLEPQVPQREPRSWCGGWMELAGLRWAAVLVALYLFYFGPDSFRRERSFAHQPVASWVTWCCPVSLTEVPLPRPRSHSGDPGTNPPGRGHGGISAGEIKHHICQPLGSLGEDCASELRKSFLSSATQGTSEALASHGEA